MQFQSESQEGFLRNYNNLILKYIWKSRIPSTANTILNKKNKKAQL